MRLPPWLYLKRLLIQATILWALLRLMLLAVALAGKVPEPSRLSARATLVLFAIVGLVSWLDLRRRNLHVLLPNLGMPVVGAVALACACALAGETLVALLWVP